MEKFNKKIIAVHYFCYFGTVKEKSLKVVSFQSQKSKLIGIPVNFNSKIESTGKNVSSWVQHEGFKDTATP